MLTRWRRVAAIVTVDLLAISALVAVAEVALRHRGLAPFVRSYPVEPSTLPPKRATWLRTDRTLGWVAGLPPPEYNAQGFRDAKDFDRIDPASDEVRVMILGDSFMVGAGVEAAGSVPALLERRLGGSVRVYNMAVSGWGIDQMYLAFQRYQERSPRVVILAYIDDDVRRVLDAFRIHEGVAKPVLKDGERQVTCRSRVAAGWPTISNGRWAGEGLPGPAPRPVLGGLSKRRSEKRRRTGLRRVELRSRDFGRRSAV